MFPLPAVLFLAAISSATQKRARRCRTERPKLKNAEELARRFPKTFRIPSREEREALAPGDYAKVIFEVPGCTGERMWLEVYQVKDEPSGITYAGRLDNDPIVYTQLKRGERFSFWPRNVIDIISEETADQYLSGVPRDLKGQLIRLADIFAIGPLMIWAGRKLADDPRGRLLLLSGYGTIIFNLANFLRYQADRRRTFKS